jgi:hypothetical protein
LLFIEPNQKVDECRVESWNIHCGLFLNSSLLWENRIAKRSTQVFIVMPGSIVRCMCRTPFWRTFIWGCTWVCEVYTTINTFVFYAFWVHTFRFRVSTVSRLISTLFTCLSILCKGWCTLLQYLQSFVCTLVHIILVYFLFVHCDGSILQLLYFCKYTCISRILLWSILVLLCAF